MVTSVLDAQSPPEELRRLIESKKALSSHFGRLRLDTTNVQDVRWSALGLMT